MGSTALLTLISQGKHVSSLLHWRLHFPTGRPWTASQEVLGRRCPANSLARKPLCPKGKPEIPLPTERAWVARSTGTEEPITPGLGNLFISMGLRVHLPLRDSKQQLQGESLQSKWPGKPSLFCRAEEPEPPACPLCPWRKRQQALAVAAAAT